MHEFWRVQAWEDALKIYDESDQQLEDRLLVNIAQHNLVAEIPPADVRDLVALARACIELSSWIEYQTEEHVGAQKARIVTVLNAINKLK